MKLKLGDELVWEGVRFELIALDSTNARLRATEEGLVRVALIAELQRDPAVEWPVRALRAVRTFDDNALSDLPPSEQRKVEVWLPHIARLDGHIRAARRDSAETNLLVSEIAERVGVQLSNGTVDPRTVWRKLSAYRASGALGFVDKRYRQKAQLRRDPLLLEVVADVCRRADTQSTGTRGRVVEDVLYDIADRYGDNPPFVIPSERTLQRIISEMPRAKHLTRSAKTRASLANTPSTPLR